MISRKLPKNQITSKSRKESIISWKLPKNPTPRKSRNSCKPWTSKATTTKKMMIWTIQAAKDTAEDPDVEETEKLMQALDVGDDHEENDDLDDIGGKRWLGENARVSPKELDIKTIT